jgi:hypothetical protein
LFLLIGALSIVFASSKIWRDGADKQRSIIRELTRHGWKVEYPPKLSAAEKATRGLLPRDYFACPYKASVGNRSLVSQRDIDLVGNLSGLEEIGIVPWKSIAPPVSFSPLQKLRRLRLLRISGHYVSESDAKCIGTFRQLRTLSITRGTMSRKAVQHIAHSSTLRDVGFGDVGLSKETIEAEFAHASNIRLSFAPSYFETFRSKESK